MLEFETKRCVNGLYLTPRAHGCTSVSRKRHVPSLEMVGGVEGGSLPYDLEEEVQFERYFHAVRSTTLLAGRVNAGMVGYWLIDLCTSPI